MKRRSFLQAAGGAVLGALMPVAKGQQRVYKVAWLAGAGREVNLPLRKILLERLARAGFVEGQSLQLVERFAEGSLDRIPALARELSKLNPDVFLVHGTQAAVGVRDVTRDVPIVFAFVSDPVSSGLVTDLSHPGGKVTGFTNMNYELIGKRLEVLREAFPAVEKVAVLYNPRNAPDNRMLEFVRKAAAPALGIELTAIELTSEGDYSRAFAAMERHRPDAFFVLENGTNVVHRRLIFDFAARHRIPAIYGFESFVDAGGLMAYSAPQTDQFVGAVEYVVKILRGSSVADLPVQLPSRFTLVVNLQTAKASGFVIPQPVLLRADRILE